MFFVNLNNHPNEKSYKPYFMERVPTLSIREKHPGANAGPEEWTIARDRHQIM
jgi:hypothetical protein